MLTRRTIPEPPDFDSLIAVNRAFEAIVEHNERIQPLFARATNLTRERVRLKNSLFDLFIEHAEVLLRSGILEILRSHVADLMENEMENIDLLIELNENFERLGEQIGERLRGE